MTTCSVHRLRKNFHAVGSRSIATELWKAAEKEKAPLARNTADLSTQINQKVSR